MFLKDNLSLFLKDNFHLNCCQFQELAYATICSAQTVFSIFTKGERIVCSVCMRHAPELDCLTHFVVIIWRSSFEREMGCRRLGRPNEGGNIKDDRSMLPRRVFKVENKKTPHRCSEGFSKKRVLRGVLELETSGFKLMLRGHSNLSLRVPSLQHYH